MQFFYLLSFVAVVSHAAALPQPAGLSEKYSNNVDITLIIAKFFKDSDFTSANISSTIDKVGDGAVDFYKDGEKAGKEIGGTAGPMLKRSLDRAIYVIVALIGWMAKEGNPILGLLSGSPLKDFEAAKILYGYISNVVTSLGYPQKAKFVLRTGQVHQMMQKTRSSGCVVANLPFKYMRFGACADSRSRSDLRFSVFDGGVSAIKD
ncbi:hypothetical protein BASA62_002835 [Batrachochytrium salamandrivorans]|nr:hypothetical protein BASA62_002835 [Batrachochytrium salamandrivorans]